MDDHDGDVLIGACYVGIVLCQFGLLAGSGAIPAKATKTALRHGYESESEFTVGASRVGFEKVNFFSAYNSNAIEGRL